MSYIILECLVCVVAGCGLATLAFLILVLTVVPIRSLGKLFVPSPGLPTRVLTPVKTSAVAIGPSKQAANAAVFGR